MKQFISMRIVDGMIVADRAALVAAPETEAKFWSRVEKSDGCWEWRGRSLAPSGGRRPYGLLSLGRRLSPLAHRLSWLLAHGELAGSMQVCHRCDNPPCVRPDHLFLGTAADNVADMIAKGRMPPNKPFRSGSGHPLAKLDDDKVRRIWALLAEGLPLLQIAKQFDVNHSTIKKILVGRTWSSR